jgi:hypothetical protein
MASMRISERETTSAFLIEYPVILCDNINYVLCL